MIYFSWASFFICIGIFLGIYYLGVFIFFIIQSKKSKTSSVQTKIEEEVEDSLIPEYHTSKPKDVYNFLSETIVTPEPETKECEEEIPNICLPVDNLDTSEESFPEISEPEIEEEPELEYKDYQEDFSNDIPFGIDADNSLTDDSEVKDTRTELNNQFSEFVLDKNEEVDDVHIGGESIDEFIVNMRKDDSPFALIPSFDEAVKASGGYSELNKL